MHDLLPKKATLLDNEMNGINHYSLHSMQCGPFSHAKQLPQGERSYIKSRWELVFQNESESLIWLLTLCKTNNVVHLSKYSKYLRLLRIPRGNLRLSPKGKNILFFLQQYDLRFHLPPVFTSYISVIVIVMTSQENRRLDRQCRVGNACVFHTE